MKYGVISRFYDNGKTTAQVIEVEDNATFYSAECLRYDEYLDVFDIPEQARDHAEAVLNA